LFAALTPPGAERLESRIQPVRDMKLDFPPHSIRMTESERFLASFPSRSAVFALFSSDSASSSPPYLSRTRDLRRRLGRLLSPKRGSRGCSTCGVRPPGEWQIVGSAFEAQWLNYFFLISSITPASTASACASNLRRFFQAYLRNRFPRCYPSPAC